MKILFASPEVFPYVKTGGLADVSGSLPKALNLLGVDIRISMPKYKGLDSKYDLLGQKVPVYFIENDDYYCREYLYGAPEGDYPDNLERFSFYCSETLSRLKKENFKPEIIHCNDWQTALIPVYLKTLYKNDDFFKNTKIVFTIHNMANQGIFQASEWDKTGLDKRLFNPEGLEFYGKINLMKAGLIFSDFITTVSPAYSLQIQTKEYGFGLENVLRSRKKEITGIINGIDFSYWDPEKDTALPNRYSYSDLDKKPLNKQYLQAEHRMAIGRDIPLIGAIGRLTDQKGWDILASAMDEISKIDLQIIILGEGESKYQKLLLELSEKYPLKICFKAGFDHILAKKIYASSDIFLMPSKFEPCGLGQLISYRYGTVPVARETGGLKDTITDYSQDHVHGSGFLFQNYDSNSLTEALARALEVYAQRRKWRALQKRIMKLDYSWDNSAKEYKKLYKNMATQHPA
ncbi:MAG: glycogen/starch synthase [Candidatus Omnitrophica bacterium]|nr:glycogen/starch synthase [Candidatus Omnitrophota bacterium]